MKKAFLISLLFLPFLATNLFSGIANTPHNLSSTSGNLIRATSETQICKFCHIPHGAQVSTSTYYQHYQDVYELGTYDFRLPLIGHQLTEADNKNRAYEDYNSTWTLPNPSAPPYEDIFWAPSGVSKVCFSCHDGTLAIGQLTTETIDMDNAVAGEWLTDPGDQLAPIWGARYLGQTENPASGVPYFPGWHPMEPQHIFSTRVTDVQIADYNRLMDELGSSNKLKTLGEMRQGLWGYPGIDKTDFVQCTGCHDPHTEYTALGGSGYKFWAVEGANSYEKVCAVCHQGYSW